MSNPNLNSFVQEFLGVHKAFSNNYTFIICSDLRFLERRSEMPFEIKFGNRNLGYQNLTSDS